MKVSSVGLAGPYNPMMRSPVLGQRLFDLFHYLRWETSVPTKLNEFAILIIGRQWRSQVEWYAHAPLAAKADLSAEIIAELKASKRPSSMADDEAMVYDFVTELAPRRSSTISRSSISRRSRAITSWWRCYWRWRKKARLRARSRRSRSAKNNVPSGPVEL